MIPTHLIYSTQIPLNSPPHWFLRIQNQFTSQCGRCCEWQRGGKRRPDRPIRQRAAPELPLHRPARDHPKRLNHFKPELIKLASTQIESGMLKTPEHHRPGERRSTHIARVMMMVGSSLVTTNTTGLSAVLKRAFTLEIHIEKVINSFFANKKIIVQNLNIIW